MVATHSQQAKQTFGLWQELFSTLCTELNQSFLVPPMALPSLEDIQTAVFHWNHLCMQARVLEQSQDEHGEKGTN